MGARKPFTQRERRRLSYGSYGKRPVNDWGGGDLPAPWAIGDVVHLAAIPEGYDASRLRGYGPGFHVVTAAYSIDDGDAWYFRIGNFDIDMNSDRLHVAHAARCSNTWRDDCDYMAPFELVETSDPEGLAERQRLLDEGWSIDLPDECPACGADLSSTARSDV